MPFLPFLPFIMDKKQVITDENILKAQEEVADEWWKGKLLKLKEEILERKMDKGVMNKLYSVTVDDIESIFNKYINE